MFVVSVRRRGVHGGGAPQGEAGSRGTWCRLEIGVRQVEGTDHVALYAPAVSSMERANHQQRPLASQRPPPSPSFLT